MKYEDIIKPLILTYSLIVFLLSTITGNSIDENIFRWASGASGALVLIYMAYERYIWRIWIFKRISEFQGIPVLHGTWKGTIQFDKDENGQPGEKDFYIAINQTLFSISLRTFIDKSEAYSVCATLQKDLSGKLQLSYLYRSGAPYGKRDNNRPHDGACILDIIRSPYLELRGAYFTERKGTGRITQTAHNPRVTEVFEHAIGLEYTPYK